MMTRQEEYQRLLEDRAEAEDESERLNEQLKDLEEDSDEWNELFDEITQLDNQAMYCSHCLQDFVDDDFFNEVLS